MNKFTLLSEFLGCLFSDNDSAKKAELILPDVWKTRSSRSSDIAPEMSGTEAANYWCLQRFLAHVSLRTVLLRLFDAEAPFLMGDPTEMPRPQA